MNYLGRRRNIPEIFSPDPRKRRRAERQAINTVCQGSGADIIKTAIININKQLKVNGFLPEARLILEMHDELLYEVVMAPSSKADAITVSFLNLS